jgi:methyltransferase (TIGR00027 family)
MDPVGLTSRWVAAARARESERADRLFDDPLAAALAGPEGFAWLDRMEPVTLPGVPGPALGPALYVAVRTRFFDDFLLDASWSIGIQQVVLVAAGMDARAFRLNWSPGTRLYELDRPKVLSAKDAVEDHPGIQPSCERHTVGVDFEQPWAQALRDAGYEAQEPSVWLIEGLLFYLSPTTVHSLLEDISSLACEGSHLGMDLVNRELLTSAVMWSLLGTFAWRGVVGRFGTDDPETLLADHGWEARVTQPGEREANYGRWPYPVAPRSVPGTPRLFLVRARRV